MARDLTGKVIIITGASSGIGAATAIECARAGMDCVLNARRVEKLNEVAEHMRKAGGRVVTVVGDVTESGISARMIEAAETELGRLDVVFANAGFGFERTVVEMAADELRQIFEVNFFAAAELLRLAGRRFIEQQRSGHLLMCSSCLSKFTFPGYSAYSATKAAQNHICRAMRFELEAMNIAVSSVHPITTTTEFFETAAEHTGREVMRPDRAPGLFVQTPQRVARAIVKCLRRPRSEVWTSHSMRLLAAMLTASPGLCDVLMRLYQRRRSKGD